jgi:hypothetical protein
MKITGNKGTEKNYNASFSSNYLWATILFDVCSGNIN